MLNPPNYRGRTPEKIIVEKIFFDSVGYAFRALSWLDIAKKNKNVCALQYAAHDTRQSIEQLLFEELILSVGTQLDRKEYEKCKGNSTKLHKIINRLSPDYAKMVEFVQAIMSQDPNVPNLIKFNHRHLLRASGEISYYLHWNGEPAETVDSESWLNKGINIVETVALYIWENKSRGYSAVLMPKDMQPEIKDCWDKYRTGALDIEAVKRIALLSLPILNQRP